VLGTSDLQFPSTSQRDFFSNPGWSDDGKPAPDVYLRLLKWSVIPMNQEQSMTRASAVNLYAEARAGGFNAS
jgi:hypothetical protein